MGMGNVHVYTGNGKGKTTAMLGLALRAAGAGLKVYIGQFMKSGEYSEVAAIRKYLPCVKIEQYGSGRPCLAEINDEDRAAAKNGMLKAREAAREGFDVVMLDEIHYAVHAGLVSVDETLELIKMKPPSVEMVLTGRYAADEIIEAADLVSEINELKHYFCMGYEARDGIEK